jgi:hypothetical protein
MTTTATRATTGGDDDDDSDDDNAAALSLEHVQARSRRVLDVFPSVSYLASATPTSIDVAVLEREVNSQSCRSRSPPVVRSPDPDRTTMTTTTATTYTTATTHTTSDAAAVSLLVDFPPVLTRPGMSETCLDVS